jgi:hypothetical protein
MVRQAVGGGVGGLDHDLVIGVDWQSSRRGTRGEKRVCAREMDWENDPTLWRWYHKELAKRRMAEGIVRQRRMKKKQSRGGA